VSGVVVVVDQVGVLTDGLSGGIRRGGQVSGGISRGG
jgi:hypothetical protein